MSQNNHGGPRPNSGPKPNAQLEHARALIDQAITDADWLDAWKQIFQIILTATDPRAKTGAMRLMCEYRFGKPTTNIEHTHTAPDAPHTPASNDPNDDPALDDPIPDNEFTLGKSIMRVTSYDSPFYSDMYPGGIELTFHKDDPHSPIHLEPPYDARAHADEYAKYLASLNTRTPVTPSEPDPDTEPLTPSPAPHPDAPPTPKRNPKLTNPKSRRARRHNAKNSTPANKPKHRIPVLTPEQKIQFKAGLAATIQSPRLRAAMGLPPLPAPPQLEQT